MEPTEREAAEAYAFYKNKYCHAASQKRASERRERGYIAERDSAKSRIRSLSGQKLNLEKRLSGIERIICMLEGDGGWRSINVPEAIFKATKRLKDADANYHSSIRTMGGAVAASLETAFATKTVEGDASSSSALQQYKAEKARLEQEIAELKTRITTLSNSISEMTRKINACNSEQASLRDTMNANAYEMNYYRRFMY